MARPNPELLVWAREEAGVSASAAALKIGITEQRLLEWEAGTSQPTFPQLRQLARTYHRALAVFFLAERPTTFRVGVDFRRMPGEIADTYSPALRLDMRDVELRRDYAVQLFESLEVDLPVFSFEAKLSEDPESVAERLRDYLKPDISSHSDQRAVFNAWRDSMYRGGTLVFLIARTPSGEMRAFSISAAKLPVVAINRHEAPSARTFSMLHEATHLALRLTGICDFSEDETQAPEVRTVEIFCNYVAGATLVPRAKLLRHPRVDAHGRSLQWDDEELGAIGRTFGASREVVLRRLLLHNKTTSEFYESTRERYMKEYAELERMRQADAGDIKRNIPQETIGLLGVPYIDAVLASFATDRVTLSEVSTLLNVRTRHVAKIATLMASR